MDALVMCGGQGTRLDVDTEKPLFPIAGQPMIERVLRALGASQVDAVRAVTSPKAPRTRETVAEVVEVLDAPGDGYVADLQYALERIEPPVLTLTADLPLVTGPTIDRVLERYERGTPTGAASGPADATVCVPRALPERLGASVDADETRVETAAEAAGEVVATGVNVVGAPDGTASIPLTLEEPRLAINVNRLADARLADRMLSTDRISDPTGRSLGGDRP